MLVEPAWVTVQEYVQLVKPVTGCQVLPLSVETSTPPTMPPPMSLAVPLMVICVPSGIVVPGVGLVIVDVGGVWSVEAVAADSPD
jgi:hypothetical protein